MRLTSAQVKGRIKNIALNNETDPRVLMRIYMMERFLERISLSSYKDNFVIKGGILITSMIGISMRSTMDIDATVKGKELNIENSKNIIMDITNIRIDDGVSFKIKEIETIMDEAEYPGIRFHIEAFFENMITPIKIDISTGDVITPKAIEYEYALMLEDRNIELLSYNLETILGEKLQTILSRERANTRMRDFYDIYVLTQKYNKEIDVTIFKKAYDATCKKRESLYLSGEENKIIDLIAKDIKLNKQWEQYQNKYSYASRIDFVDTIVSIKKLISYLI